MTQSPGFTDKGQMVHAIFTRIARNYDWTNAFLSLCQDKRWRRMAVRHCRPVPGEKGLDLGCGTGMITRQLAQSLKGAGEIVGLDFNAAMLKVAREKTAKFPYCHAIRWVQGNAMNLPFSEASFDYIVAGFVLRNVERIEQALDEMIRVVKPGGRLVILELSTPSIPIFAQIYKLYFHHVLPWVGRSICGSDLPYRYLPSSVLSFPDPKAFAETLLARGLVNVNVLSLSGGIAFLYTGEKPS